MNNATNKPPIKAQVIYWSKTGNTAKVARTIHTALGADGVETALLPVEQDETTDVDFYAYDLLCIGFPSYRWSPPKPMDDFLKAKFNQYHRQGRVQVGATPIPGRYALIFCTYSGPHTGIREAIPAGLYAGQFFEHLGFTVLDEWYIVGEFHGSKEASTQGRLGDIRGRPNAEDLEKIAQDVSRLLRHIRAEGGITS